MTRKEFRVYSVGMVYASVCTSLNDEEATKSLNAEHPTGISSQWSVSEDETFVDGQPNPCKCPDAPETHRHILFSC